MVRFVIVLRILLAGLLLVHSDILKFPPSSISSSLLSHFTSFIVRLADQKMSRNQALGLVNFGPCVSTLESSNVEIAVNFNSDVSQYYKSLFFKNFERAGMWSAFAPVVVQSVVVQYM